MCCCEGVQVEPVRGGVAGWLSSRRPWVRISDVHFAIIYAGFGGCEEQRGGCGSGLGVDWLQQTHPCTW